MSGAAPMLHRAARIEDAIHRFRAKWGRRRGLVVTVVPYVGYGSTGWARVLCRVLLTRRRADSTDRYENIRGWRSFLSIPVWDVDVVITIGDQEHTVRAGRGGVVDERIPMQLPPGWHTISMRTEGSEPVEARIFVVDPAVTVGLVSDIDDTVMVTALPRPFLAAWNTFVLNEHARRPVAGMAVLYERLLTRHPGAPVIYLSTGAWNVAPTLSRFLGRNLYPRGAMLLTDWGPTHDRWFRSGQEHKRSNLERLAQEFPSMTWILVGDDGQHDEARYGEFAANHPENVAAVAIRQLSVGEAVLAGGRSKAAEHARAGGPTWHYAPDGAGLAEELGLSTSTETQMLETDTP
jgi:phosphatidate phosphatase APP1